jgi:hypothetical protein
MEEMTWKVGELARTTGLTVRTLHHWDALGLPTPSERTPAGYRLYDEGDVRRLYQIVARFAASPFRSRRSRTLLTPASTYACLPRGSIEVTLCRLLRQQGSSG